MHRIAAALLAATVCAPAAQAQLAPPDVAGEALTLEQALDLAGATAPDIDAAAAGLRAAEAQRRLAGLRPNPSVDVEVANMIGTGNYRGLREAETTAALALPLELGGKRSARIGVADAQTARARLDLAAARAELVFQVTRAFIAAVAADQRLAVARDQLGIAGEGLRAAQVRVRAGRASPLEAQRAELVQVNAANGADQAARAAALARDNLALLTGRAPGAIAGGWFGDTGSAGPRPPASVEGTLSLAAAEAEVATANAQVRLARSQRVPDLTLRAGARRFEATNDIAAVFGVSIPLPVFNDGRAAVDAAAAQRTQAEALRRAARRDAAQAIAAAETDLANAQASARTATGPALAAAQEAARIARIGYREGKFGQLDLLEAERTLAQTRIAAIESLAAYHDARARLVRLTAAAPASMEDRK